MAKKDEVATNEVAQPDYSPAIGDLVNVKYKGGSAKAYYKGIDADGNHLFSKANTAGKPMKAVVTFEGITGVEAVK